MDDLGMRELLLDVDDALKGMDKSSSASDFGKGMSESGATVVSPSWRGLSKCSSSDLGKGVSETVVSEEGTPSSAKGLWRGLSRCSSSDSGKVMSKSAEAGVAVSLKGTGLGKPKRMCLGRGLSYFLRNGKMSKRKEKRKRVSEEEERRLRVKLSNINLYFPSTSVDFCYCEFIAHPNSISLTYPSRNRNPIRVVKGEKLEEDVVSLLSNVGKRDYLVRNNGDKVSVDSIVGKHLLICCFKVPLPNQDAYYCRAMIAAYSHLRNNNENFEMVMVAKMANANVAVDDEAAFTRFFEAFPCLAVPLWDVESRDFLCSSLGLTRNCTHCAAAVVDPHQVVLQTDAMCFYEYGASGFPYSDERLNALHEEDVEFRRKLDFLGNDGLLSAPVSLVELLGSNYHLHRFSGGDGISALDLSKKKCVVLYLCVNGMEMWMMENLRKGCEDVEFEILLVHIPFMWDTPSFVNVVNNALAKQKLSSWLVAPLIDEEAARRLWRLCDQSEYDAFIFLADGGKGVELDGERFIHNFPSEYPFTRMTIAQNSFCNLRKDVTLDSLFGRSTVMSQLKGRKVLLYLDWCENVFTGSGSPIYKKLVQYYEKIKKDHPDLEVVLVRLHDTDEGPDLELDLAPTPWLLLPDDVDEKLLTDNWAVGFPPCLVAFGEDGTICSTPAQRRLGRGSLFADTLYQDIVDKLKAYRWD